MCEPEMTPGCALFETAASYVLGALDEPEYEAFRQHLSECEHCRCEIAEFSSVVALLGEARAFVVGGRD